MFTEALSSKGVWKICNWVLISLLKKLNLTMPDTVQINLRRRSYTPYSDPRGFIYENKDKKNRLMELELQYLPPDFWSQRDKANARAMIQAIDKRLKTRRIMRSLERFVAYSKASHIDESIPQKEKDPWSFTLPCFINNVCFDNVLVNLGASVSVMPLLTYLNLGLGELAHTKLTMELADRTVKYPKGIAENVLVRIGKFTFPVDFIILDMPEDIKVPLILGRPFLSTARAKIDVYKRKITLRVGEEKIIFKSVKPASSLIKRVYMLSLRERMELDLEARLMGETLVINRSLDPLNGDYIKLNDLNEPFELRRNQGDDLMPTIEEGEVIKEFRTRDEDLDTRIDDYPSYCDDDKKIHIDCARN
ncbi:hypothetical protein Tco_0216630 [Tanacetum coccineum]